jgi:hypothetical protein
MPLPLNKFPEEVKFVASKDFYYDDMHYNKGDVIPDARDWMKLEILVRNRFVLPVWDDRTMTPKMFWREVKTTEAAEHILRMPISGGTTGRSTDGESVTLPTFEPYWNEDHWEVVVPYTENVDTFLYGVAGHAETEPITEDVIVTSNDVGQFWIGYQPHEGYTESNEGTTGVGFPDDMSGSSSSSVIEAPAYDPGDHTIKEIMAYVDAHPDEVYAMLEAEEAGKNRVMLISWLHQRIAAKEGS